MLDAKPVTAEELGFGFGPSSDEEDQEMEVEVDKSLGFKSSPAKLVDQNQRLKSDLDALSSLCAGITDYVERLEELENMAPTV